MKKVISLLLIMILFLSGCSTKNETLANNDWKFSRIVDTQSGNVTFSSEKEASKFNGAKVADLSCTADDSKITIKDNATGNEWTLDYIKNNTIKTNNEDGANFDITYTTEEKAVKGFATTGVVNQNGEDGSDYLIINLDGYELHFNNIEEIKIG